MHKSFHEALAKFLAFAYPVMAVVQNTLASLLFLQGAAGDRGERGMTGNKVWTKTSFVFAQFDRQIASPNHLHIHLGNIRKYLFSFMQCSSFLILQIREYYTFCFLFKAKGK